LVEVKLKGFVQGRIGCDLFFIIGQLLARETRLRKVATKF
jgi:hypothetical protein